MTNLIILVGVLNKIVLVSFRFLVVWTHHHCETCHSNILYYNFVHRIHICLLANVYVYTVVSDTESKHQDGPDVYVNITSHKVKLLFEMIPGLKTSNFVGELYRSIERKYRQ